MSGHSKWSTIKRKKGAIDQARAKIFTKLGREIQVAVKSGGPDPASNPRLKDAIAKAKANNMPNDNINRSITKASGTGADENFEEITYEGYGPNGVAVIVRTLTDNKNRTAGEVRHAFDKNGGNLGTAGSVSFMFEDKGSILIAKENIEDDDELMMVALDAGADDMINEEEFNLIYTAPADFETVRQALETAGYIIEEAVVEPVPNTWVSVEATEVRQSLRKMIDMLEDSDDVQDIFHNWENEDE